MDQRTLLDCCLVSIIGHMSVSIRQRLVVFRVGTTWVRQLVKMLSVTAAGAAPDLELLCFFIPGVGSFFE